MNGKDDEVNILPGGGIEKLRLLDGSRNLSQAFSSVPAFTRYRPQFVGNEPLLMESLWKWPSGCDLGPKDISGAQAQQEREDYQDPGGKFAAPNHVLWLLLYILGCRIDG